MRPLATYMQYAFKANVRHMRRFSEYPPPAVVAHMPANGIRDINNTQCKWLRKWLWPNKTARASTNTHSVRGARMTIQNLHMALLTSDTYFMLIFGFWIRAHGYTVTHFKRNHSHVYVLDKFGLTKQEFSSKENLCFYFSTRNKQAKMSWNEIHKNPVGRRRPWHKWAFAAVCMITFLSAAVVDDAVRLGWVIRDRVCRCRFLSRFVHNFVRTPRVGDCRLADAVQGKSQRERNGCGLCDGRAQLVRLCCAQMKNIDSKGERNTHIEKKRNKKSKMF